jgi:hypothetical protein
MMRNMKKTSTVVLALALMAAGCSDPLPPAAPTPATPTIVENITGTLLVNGSNTHPFTVTQIGGVTVVLNSVAPSAAIGIGIGTPSTGSCLVLANTSAVGGADTLLSGTATVSGNFCVLVSDVGNLVESVNYTLTLTHS